MLSNQSIVKSRTTHDRLDMFVVRVRSRDLLLRVSVSPHAPRLGMTYRKVCHHILLVVGHGRKVLLVKDSTMVNEDPGKRCVGQLWGCSQLI